MKVDIHYHLKNGDKPIVATVDGIDDMDEFLDDLHGSLDDKFVGVEGRDEVVEVLIATDSLERVYVVEVGN